MVSKIVTVVLDINNVVKKCLYLYNIIYIEYLIKPKLLIFYIMFKSSNNDKQAEFIECFYNTNVIKKSNTYDFTLKSGEKSNIYIDFRKLTSYPSLLKNVCKELNKNITKIMVKSIYDGKNKKIGLGDRLRSIQKSKSLPDNNVYSSSDQSRVPKSHLIGVPMGGNSIAQTLSVQYDYSCLYLRKDVKTYGLKRELEGDWKQGDRVILIDDVITSGISLLECIDKLERIGVIIIKVVVLLCRSNEGVKNIWNNKRIRVESLFSMEDIVKNDDNIEKTHDLSECPF